MSDRQLLADAAKAYGRKVIAFAEDQPESAGPGLILEGSSRVWNPFADYGECFKLAMHLGIAVQPVEGGILVRRPAGRGRPEVRLHTYCTPGHMVIICRQVVRLAALISKEK